MKWTIVSIAEAELMLENEELLLLDMRDYRAYLENHHPRALHLNDQNLRALLKHTDRSVPVLIYCYHGHRSQDMAQLFSDFGFTSCYSLDGGYEAWFPEFRLASQELSDNLLEWLLINGFDPENVDHRGPNNETALMQLCRLGQRDLALEMLAAGTRVSLTNKDGCNALWMAVQSSDQALVHALLQAGTPLNQQNDNGATALMLAMSLGQLPVVRYLLNAGADITLTTIDGFSAEDVAANRRVLNEFNQWKVSHAKAA